MISIYKIHKPGDNNFYIGSTDDMRRRYTEHKADCKAGQPNCHRYFNEHGGFHSWIMIKIGECEEDREGEKEIIRTQQPYLNVIKYEFRCKHEYRKAHYQANKEMVAISNAAYYQANKEILKKAKQLHYEANIDIYSLRYLCECGGKYTYINKTAHEKTAIHKAYFDL